MSKPIDYDNEVLANRHVTHGDYRNTATCAQEMKHAFFDTLAKSGQKICLKSHDMEIESVELIITKLARLASGDLGNLDTWRDIAGYAELPVFRRENG